MVFKCVIGSVTQARVFLCNVKRLSIRRVAEMCHISRGSVWRIAKERVVARESVRNELKRVQVPS